MIRAGIIGATGFVGAELTRLIANHPEVDIAFLDSRTYKDKEFGKVYPNMLDIITEKCSTVNMEYDLENIDILFSALPHGLSQSAIKHALSKGVKVIDLSADFRIDDVDTYEAWYKVAHTAKEELKDAVYGLCEINRGKIPNAKLIANPGCYPTSIILALYPLLKEKIISDQDIPIADSKSGVSGAGRTPSEGNLYALCNENMKAYGIGSHRHTPEIEQELSKAAGGEMFIQFTPHLAPMTRGILSTIYVKNLKGLDYDAIKSVYSKYYGEEPFVRILDKDVYPQTKAVYASNYCDIGFKVDERTKSIIIVSAIDNLVKGAAGQAIQNMNIMFGIDETEGLNHVPILP
ncbi:N-acetyl-gamma-glutamyl-phosphate reductase [Serpentinicella sp. ANB-PHB4]|uniref:N-acetyl-gamma-glutamyl-phosphate reductase n=1 Tax=Serpentinicella sp. ANB-PHB4 TaxID=3074076 RepID=UPI0028579CA7|nr:N-acetyl-gamma-glutamyl-phosphate reductase [Serpentinicella sp. ANB-PHB4]MDR5659893.1 N-acetyl-gamma-glutamyl-phosphate reductase [Serpentinicella sp. ANB-PHB4]